MSAPTITTQPASQTNGLGDSAIFSVGVYGSRPLNYQWRFNGNPVLNATNASHIVNGISTNDAEGLLAQLDPDTSFEQSMRRHIDLEVVESEHVMHTCIRANTMPGAKGCQTSPHESLAR